MNPCPQCISFVETSAQIRNYLQPAKTALEMMKDGKRVPQKLIETALKDLEKAVNKLP